MSCSWLTETRRQGGTSETEATELAAMPHGFPSGVRAVLTVTPVANRPSSWRNCAGSTPCMGLPEQASKHTGSQDPPRGDEIPRRAHHKICEVWSARQAPDHAIGEGGPPDAEPD